MQPGSPTVSTLPRDFDRCTAAETAAHRLRAINESLPGQMLLKHLEAAQLQYGQLFTIAEIRQRVGATLPRRVGFVRGATLEPIEDYRQPIPDEALLKYDDALRSGLFSKFWVATPTYYQERQADPWILGEVKDSEEMGSARYAAIAQWDV